MSHCTEDERELIEAAVAVAVERNSGDEKGFWGVVNRVAAARVTPEAKAAFAQAYLEFRLAGKLQAQLRDGLPSSVVREIIDGIEKGLERGDV